MIKYPEEVRMEAIERMVKIAKLQDETFRISLYKEWEFANKLNLKISEIMNEIRIKAIEAIYGS